MKNNTIRHTLQILLLAVFSLQAAHLYAHEGHKDHDDHESTETHAKKAGPNGGRLVVHEHIRLEFLAKPGEQVEIRFLDEAGTVVAPAEQTLDLIGGSRSAPFKLNFVPSGNMLISEKPLPDAGTVPVILSIRPQPDASLVRERFTLNFSHCPGCDLAEYACICGH